MKDYLIFLIFLFTGLSSFGLRINEVCTANFSIYQHGGSTKDWVEIFNESTSPVNLSDYYLTDDQDEPLKWQFPDEILNPGSYRVFIADKDALSDSIINFGLKSGGMSLYLFRFDESEQDQLIIPALRYDHSYGLLGNAAYFFEKPTPWQANALSTGYLGYTDAPLISLSSGWYNGGDVNISKSDPDSEIWYSFNGTDPQLGEEYAGSIYLNGNLALKIICTKDSMLPSPAVYRSYFTDAWHHLPVVHLHIDSLEFFDDSLGIYMMGKEANPYYPYYGANFWKDIEVHAYYEYFDEERTIQESLDCGVKIHGGTVSVTRPMKSLRLISHGFFEQEEFRHHYFDLKPYQPRKRLILRNSGSDFNKTHLKDAFLHQLALKHSLDLDVQAYRPVIVYLNGHYWGIHNMREKIDKYYVTANYGSDPELVNMLEEEELYVIAGDCTQFVALKDYILASDLSQPPVYTNVAAQLDVHSMADYFVMELFFNNRDWPYNNLKLWNSPEHPQWRYILSDLDASCKYYGTNQLDYHSLETIMGTYGDNNIHILIFRKLLEYPEFKRYFVNRYSDLLNTVFQNNKMSIEVDVVSDLIRFDMARHFYKWWGVMEEWDKELEELKLFFTDRVAIVRNEISQVFGFSPSSELYVGMYPGNSGTIELNTLELDSFPFTGHYYEENEIDLQVIPGDGKRFLFWENITTGEIYYKEHLLVGPEPGDSLIAVFVADEGSLNLRVAPNPVSEKFKLYYSVPVSCKVEIRLYTSSGNYVYGANLGYQARGSHEELIAVTGLHPGTYLLSVTAGNDKDGIKILVVE